MQNEAKPWEKDPIIQKASKPLDFSAYGELVGPAPSASLGTAPKPAQSDPEELDYDGEFSDRDFDLFADVVGQI